MSKKLEEILIKNQKQFYRYLKKVCSHKRKLLVKGDLLEIFEQLHKKNNNSVNSETIRKIVNKFTESVCIDCSVYIEIRETIGKSEYYSFNVENSASKKISVVEYLKAKERYRYPLLDNELLTLNFQNLLR